MPVAFAELRVAVAVRVDGAVLLPQQHQRHGLAPQLAVDMRPVRLRAFLTPDLIPTWALTLILTWALDFIMPATG